jgi:hypothetical protein
MSFPSKVGLATVGKTILIRNVTQRRATFCRSAGAANSGFTPWRAPWLRMNGVPGASRIAWGETPKKAAFLARDRGGAGASTRNMGCFPIAGTPLA